MNITTRLVLPLLLACPLIRGQSPGADTAYLPISDPHLATSIVARVGPATITAREFLLSYEFGPAFVKREKNPQRRYLDFMINEKLLALDAADRGGRLSPEVRRSVIEIEGDLATEELYREDVLKKVRITEEEIGYAVAGQRIHYQAPMGVLRHAGGDRTLPPASRRGDEVRQCVCHATGRFAHARPALLGDNAVHIEEASARRLSLLWIP